VAIEIDGDARRGRVSPVKPSSTADDTFFATAVAAGATHFLQQGMKYTAHESWGWQQHVVLGPLSPT